MKEWKYRRNIFYSMLPPDHKHGDEPELFNGIVHKNFTKTNIIQDAINYITIHRDDLYYPGKSFAVAIMYASWIEDEFAGEDLYTLLDDPDLLPGDDYFVPYSQAKDIYDSIIEFIDNNMNCDIPNDVQLPYVEMTKHYFEKEFMLDEEGLKILPRKK
jgi:hypothetical protein